MLKYVDINSLRENGFTSEKFKEIRENPDKQFYTIAHELIIFQKENLSKIEDIVGMKIEKENIENLSVYIYMFDGGEYYQIPNTEIQIGIDSCIEKMIKNLKTYETRILHADEANKEISQILNELLLPACNEKIKEIQKSLNNEQEKMKTGKFKWN